MPTIFALIVVTVRLFAAWKREALIQPLSMLSDTVPSFVLPIVVGTEEIAMLNGRVATCTGLPESLTRAVKLNVPMLLGVPVRAPVFALSARPPGSEPLVSVQLNGAVPPVMAIAAE